VIASALIFFGGELIWRQQFPHFFPDGGLSLQPGFRMYVAGRLLVVFLLVSMIPLLLFLLSVERSQTLLYTDQPQLILANLIVLQAFILLVGTATSVGLILLLARSILDPLRALEHGMSRVAQNHYEVHVPVLSNDELGYLSERFNQMTDGLRQADRMRRLFDLYASAEVVEAALEGGANLGGELVHCTILFTDVRDFTALSERLEPERLVSLINHYMSAIVPQIAASGGVITRFGGDSILAVFGSPLNPIDDHAFRAVRAARSIHQALLRFNKLQHLAREPELKIGVGIATGPVIAGNVGGQERLEYTVMGEAANMAARLQELTKEYQCPVLVSDGTYHDLPPLVRRLFEKRTDVVIRGKQEPVTIYALPVDKVLILTEEQTV
jgi:adenylate cyclase